MIKEELDIVRTLEDTHLNPGNTYKYLLCDQLILI